VVQASVWPQASAITFPKMDEIGSVDEADCSEDRLVGMA
jgi:hypothetical protein